MFNKTRNKINELKDELKFNTDSFTHSDMENNKLMITLGYYGNVCKEMIKLGIENVGDMNLLIEHENTTKTVQNLFHYTSKSITNFMNPTETKRQRLETYYKLETLLNYCLNNNIPAITLKLRKGLLKRKETLLVETELVEIRELMKECAI